MSKLRWDKARRQERVRWYETTSRTKANAQARKRRQAMLDKPAGAIWPAFVTDGMRDDGTLRVLVFANREEADAAGWPWVGR